MLVSTDTNTEIFDQINNIWSMFVNIYRVIVYCLVFFSKWKYFAVMHSMNYESFHLWKTPDLQAFIHAAHHSKVPFWEKYQTIHNNSINIYKHRSNICLFGQMFLYLYLLVLTSKQQITFLDAFLKKCILIITQSIINQFGR